MAVESNDNVIDSLDIEQEIADIRDELENDSPSDYRAEELLERLEALEDLAEQGRGFEDWQDGITLIHEDFFPEYVEELCHDIYGAVPDYLSAHVNWEGVADDFRDEYWEVTFEGSTYYIR